MDRNGTETDSTVMLEDWDPVLEAVEVTIEMAGRIFTVGALVRAGECPK